MDTRAPQTPRRAPASFHALQFSTLPNFLASPYSGIFITPPEGRFLQSTPSPFLADAFDCHRNALPYADAHGAECARALAASQLIQGR